VRYQSVRDYTCTFQKRERIDGKMIPLHILAMKVRTHPESVYVRFLEPAAGREAIYIAGRNAGMVLAHDVGWKKLIAGTLRLEPTGARAMEDCRHPITDAGIGPLMKTLKTRWSREPEVTESAVTIRSDESVGRRPCRLIETVHPVRQRDLMFYKVRVFIDLELGLPIRFEAYDWPASAALDPEILEEYTYSNLKLNVGLTDRDFDITNPDYAFGRF
jgi:hypothetical protein